MCITVEWLKAIVGLSCFFLWLTRIGIWSCCWEFFLIVLGSGWVCKCGFRSWRFNGMITVTSSSRYKLHSRHWLSSGRDTTTCLFSGGMLYAHCSYHFVEWYFLAFRFFFTFGLLPSGFEPFCINVLNLVVLLSLAWYFFVLKVLLSVRFECDRIVYSAIRL